MRRRSKEVTDRKSEKGMKRKDAVPHMVPSLGEVRL